jgi:hypothetical protein
MKIRYKEFIASVEKERPMTENKVTDINSLQDNQPPIEQEPTAQSTAETQKSIETAEPPAPLEAVADTQPQNNLEVIEARIEELHDELDAIDISAPDSKHIVPEDLRPKGALTKFWLRYAGRDPKYYTEDSARTAKRAGQGLFATVMMGSGAISAIAAPSIAKAVTHAVQMPNSAGIIMLTAFLGTLVAAQGAFKFIDTTIVDGVREKKVAAEIIKEVKASAENVGQADTLAKKLETAAFSAQHMGVKATSGLSGDTILKLRLGLIGAFAFLSTWKFLTEVSEGAHITENLRLAHNEHFSDSNQTLLHGYEEEYMKRKAARIAAEQNLTGLHDVRNGVVGDVQLHGPLAEQKEVILGDISKLQQDLAAAKAKAEQYKTLFSKEVLGEKTTVEIDGVPYETSGKQSQAVGGGYSGPQNKLYKGFLDKAEGNVHAIEGQITAKRSEIEHLYDQARKLEEGALASRKDGVESRISTAEEDVEIARKKELAYKDHEALAMQDPKYKEFNQFEGRDAEMIRIMTQTFGPIDWLKTAALAGFVGTLELSAVIHAVTAKLNDGERNELRHDDEKALRSLQASSLQVQIAELERQKRQILNDRANRAAELARLEAEKDTAAQKLSLENKGLQQESTLLAQRTPLAEAKAGHADKLKIAEEAAFRAEESLWALQDAQRQERHAHEELVAAQRQIHATIMGRIESARLEDLSPGERDAVLAETQKILDKAAQNATANDNRSAPDQQAFRLDQAAPAATQG